MAEFNPDLHAFLMENETCIWQEKDELKFGVHVRFHDLQNFIKIIGVYALSDEGIECTLNNEYTLYIPLEDYFMNSDYTIHYYKHCFIEEDLERYKEAIAKFDQQPN